MPLAFDSLNRGRIAFGFFNIESDMLLLQELFFFADAFCEGVCDIAMAAPGAAITSTWPGYVIDRPQDVGDLQGAIQGVRFEGFLGDVYRRYPFPAREKDFKQKPDGSRTQAILRDLIEKHAERTEIPFAADPATERASIGAYQFARREFLDLVTYVWRGGWPRWRDEVRPVYVLAMRDAITRTEHWLLRDLRLG